MCQKIGTHNGAEHWLNLDCCGFVCASLTYLLILFGWITTTRHVISPLFRDSWSAWFQCIIFSALCLMAGYTHFLTMTTNPGAVPGSAVPLNVDEEFEIGHGKLNSLRSNMYCMKCNAYKPKRAHHCSVCNRCVVKMDHHCPWVNNCVGIGNQKLFIQFVFWIFLTSLYSLLLLVGLFLNCSTYSEAECIDDLGAFICIMLLFVEAILFGIFTLCMMGEQLSSASSNESHIDRLKAASSGDERVKEKLEVRIINEIFGCDMAVRFHWSWLIPVPTRFSPDMNDSLMGYRMSPASRDDVIRDDVLVSGASGSPSGSGAIEDETVVGSGTPDVMSSIHEGPGIGGSHSISIRKRQPGPVVMASEDPSSSTSRLGEDRDE